MVDNATPMALPLSLREGSGPPSLARTALKPPPPSPRAKQGLQGRIMKRALA
jgi:hypothetical protein